ncbi:MAG TPA: hypothetical protein VK814_11250 [Acidobacteriaceae bacterium]|jgi:hypothetical protein|nr:hypothetical protein [Acidobacteriaceae bacterium]
MKARSGTLNKDRFLRLAAAVPVAGTEGLVLDTVKGWVNLPSRPGLQVNLAALWANYNGAAEFYSAGDKTGSTLLQQAMNGAFPTLHLQVVDLDPTGKITVVNDLVGLV